MRTPQLTEAPSRRLRRDSSHKWPESNKSKLQQQQGKCVRKTVCRERRRKTPPASRLWATRGGTNSTVPTNVDMKPFGSMPVNEVSRPFGLATHTHWLSARARPRQAEPSARRDRCGESGTATHTQTLLPFQRTGPGPGRPAGHAVELKARSGPHPALP